MVAENYIRKAKVLKVVDGDTLYLLIDMGFHTYRQEKIRLNRIDAYEKSSDIGMKAKNFVMQELPVGTNILIQTVQNKDDMYARWLGEVYLPNGQCLNDILVKQGYAIYKEY